VEGRTIIKSRSLHPFLQPPPTHSFPLTHAAELTDEFCYGLGMVWGGFQSLTLDWGTPAVVRALVPSAGWFPSFSELLYGSECTTVSGLAIVTTVR
jgi:hypothetical protein